MPLEISESHKIIDSCCSLVRQAINRFGLLEKNSSVLVAISGGVDSLVLLLLLLEYNNRHNQKWRIHACHVDPQFPKWNSGTLKKFFRKNNIPFTIIKTNINKKIVNSSNKCYSCARERRRKLLELADGLNIFQIALAHHQEDVAETTFLNMMYNGEISTLVPKQSVIQGRFYFIRPLYYLNKEKILQVANVYHIPKNNNICPYYKESKRELVRKFLAKIRKENPDIYKNIFRSLFHIKNTYMPH